MCYYLITFIKREKDTPRGQITDYPGIYAMNQMRRQLKVSGPSFLYLLEILPGLNLVYYDHERIRESDVRTQQRSKYFIILVQRGFLHLGK